MMANHTVTAKWSDKTMEGDEGLRTVECLRGRLLAERAASKAANAESEQIAEKVVELEKQLKMEIKSRNKAEKRLKFLMKKLDSLNISYVSGDESSSVSGKSEVSSVSSSKSQNQMELQKPQFRNSGERHYCPSQEDNLGSVDESISGNSSENVTQSSQKDDLDDEDALRKQENNGLKYEVRKSDIDNEGHDDYNVDNSMALVTVEEKTITGRGHDDYNVDNSMALVRVEEKAITSRAHDDDRFDNSMALVVVKEDAPICNSNVKDVLDALRYARESLQASMEMRRRHITSNISQATLNGISC